MELKFKFLGILLILISTATSIINKPKPEAATLNKKVASVYQKQVQQKKKYHYIKFPFKGVKHDIGKYNEATGDSDNTNDTNDTNSSEVKKPGEEKPKPFRNVETPSDTLERWIVTIDNCEIVSVAKKKGEKDDPNQPKPEVEILKYDPETGALEKAEDGKIENDYYFDPSRNIIRDDTKGFGYGFKIAGHVISPQQLEVESKTELRSWIHPGVLSNGTFKGIEAYFLVFQEPSDEKPVMRIRCEQILLRKEYLTQEEMNANSKKKWEFIGTNVMSGLLILAVLYIKDF